MDVDQLIRVNMPMVLVNVLANLFFVFCLMRPFQGETLKQPLKLLLWTVICSTLFFLVSLLVLFHLGNISIVANISIYGMFVFSVSISMNTSVWLNFFYYMQIVPSKSAVFVWIKRNLKPIIYCIWVMEKLLSSLFVSSIIWYDISEIKLEQEHLNIMNTSSVMFTESPDLLVNVILMVSISEIYFIISLCVMSASSWSTVIYLSRHMRHMASQGLPSSRFRSQVRVTASGILQGALYALLCLWTLSRYGFSNLLVGSGAYLTVDNITVINVYTMGTSVNVGVGQTVFRQRAVDLWRRALRCAAAKPPNRNEK